MIIAENFSRFVFYFEFMGSLKIHIWDKNFNLLTKTEKMYKNKNLIKKYIIKYEKNLIEEDTPYIF